MVHSRRARRLCGQGSALLVALLAATGTLDAQQGAIVGRVVSIRDSTPIVGLLVEIPILRVRTVSDTAGMFQLAGVSQGTHQVLMTRIGYGQQRMTIRLRNLGEVLDLGTLQLTPTSEPLAAITVEAPRQNSRLEMAGFYERMEQGFGSFADREDLDEWNPQQFTDALRHMRGFIIERNRNYGKPLPPRTSEFGYALSPSMGTDTRRYVIRARRSGRKECPPMVYLDGTQFGNALDFDINQFDPDVIEGVEAYFGPGQIPAEYNRPGSDCGVVLIWTR